MKIQDALFIVILLIFLLLRKREYVVYAGVGMMLLAMPLFAKWVFFTAERLTWYAAAFFLSALCMDMHFFRKDHRL